MNNDFVDAEMFATDFTDTDGEVFKKIKRPLKSSRFNKKKHPKFDGIHRRRKKVVKYEVTNERIQ